MSPWCWPVRVYYEDTDAGGVVYHANYLRYLERARTEGLRQLGYSQQHLRDAAGVLFVVVSCSVQFKQPARLDDLLEVRSSARLTGAVSLEFAQEIYRPGDASAVLVSATVRVACLEHASYRPCRLPASLRKEFI
jgi:acyl-CoA thioester hydrolase